MALRDTIRLMGEVDGVIESVGGCQICEKRLKVRPELIWFLENYFEILYDFQIEKSKMDGK